ncbi:MAG: hypothetical protein QM523_03265 [Candidatus Pacebacteria bacterium]|nr:hypothetical protein [Candidatus Paceibacterota bacterium]
MTNLNLINQYESTQKSDEEIYQEDLAIIDGFAKNSPMNPKTQNDWERF